jgi:BirA family biotin operon repressor/biotin-[acetyl-CoA-carboxylase] ligase
MALRPEEFANQLIDRCASTNDLCRLLGESGYPHGSWVSARIQDQGRGRLGRQWQSLEGNLFFSMLVRPVRRELTSWIPLTAGLACAVALERVQAPAGIRLKWPNDLWLGGAKAGGLLCEGVSGLNGVFVVIGIGLNCTSAPENVGQPTASLGVSADVLRPVLIKELLSWLSLLEQQGSDPVRREYEKRALFSPGTHVSWSGRTGTVLGLGEAGQLRVKCQDDGTELLLLAEDVSVRPDRPKDQLS